MTLILSRCSGQYVTQAMDRMVATEAGNEFDPQSNKNILYASSDGIVSIAYTGIAFLGNIPTDQWLVEQITETKFDRLRKPAVIGLGQEWEPKEQLGQTMLRIKDALEKGATAVPKDWQVAWTKQSFDLTAVGWQWNKRGRARPIIASVLKNPDENNFQITYRNRLWHYRQTQGLPYTVYAAPTTNYPTADCEAMTARLANRTSQESECVMVEEIRRIADNNNYVGKHVLTVTLSPPQSGRGVITDHPTVPMIHSMSRFNPDLKAEVNLTPWVIGKNFIQPPALLTHNMDIELGGYRITLTGPNKPGHFFFGSLRRPQL